MAEEKDELKFTLRRGVGDKGYTLYKGSLARGYYISNGKSLITTTKKLLNEQITKSPQQVSIEIKLTPLNTEEELIIESMKSLEKSHNNLIEYEEIKKMRRALY